MLLTENVDFPKPRQQTCKRKDASRYCDFHKDIGHTTDECFNLRRHIEDAIKSGKLAHLVKNIRQGPQNNDARAEQPENVIRDLH